MHTLTPIYLRKYQNGLFLNGFSSQKLINPGSLVNAAVKLLEVKLYLLLTVCAFLAPSVSLPLLWKKRGLIV